MFQLLGVEVTKAQLSFDTTVISRVQKVGSIVPLESRIYAVWSLNIEGGNILYNSVGWGLKEAKAKTIVVVAVACRQVICQLACCC